jgi:FKBP-type peptidyl-prolyl cis-trans isomerase FkpA
METQADISNNKIIKMKSLHKSTKVKMKSFSIHIVLGIFVVSVSLASSCNTNKNPPANVLNAEEQKEKLIEINKDLVELESERIDKYIERRGYQAIKSGTGLRYFVYKQGSGENAKQGQMAKVSYTVHLLDGTFCYSTEKEGPEEFLVGKDYVESGLHEGITHMNTGSKAKLILPPHLAHGIIGDLNKIPMNASLVYDIELISLK